MDERQLFDRVHAALDVEPNPGAYDRLRYALTRTPSRPSTWPRLDLWLPRISHRVIAAALVAVLVAAGLGVYLVTRGSPNRTVPAGQPVGTILFGQVDATGKEHVFTIHSDGTHLKQLVAGTSSNMQWSHKGDRIMLAASLGLHPAYNCPICPITAAIVNADGTGYRTLPLDSPTLSLGPGQWSPDDRRIAFEGWDDSNFSLNGIYTADAADGGNRVRVTTSPQVPGATDSNRDMPVSYSPDGSKILFWRGPFPSGQLFVVGANGGTVTQVSPPGMTVFIPHGPAPFASWSPDGTQVSFAALAADSSGPDGWSAVFVASSDGTNVKQITTWGWGTASALWSPRGSWIVFSRYGQAVGTRHLFLIHPDGTGDKVVSTMPEACCAVWSPDGNRLLFLRAPAPFNTLAPLQQSQLWVVGIDGSNPTPLTETFANLSEYQWAPSG